MKRIALFALITSTVLSLPAHAGGLWLNEFGDPSGGRASAGAVAGVDVDPGGADVSLVVGQAWIVGIPAEESAVEPHVRALRLVCRRQRAVRVVVDLAGCCVRCSRAQGRPVDQVSPVVGDRLLIAGSLLDRIQG